MRKVKESWNWRIFRRYFKYLK